MSETMASKRRRTPRRTQAPKLTYQVTKRIVTPVELKHMYDAGVDIVRVWVTDGNGNGYLTTDREFMHTSFAVFELSDNDNRVIVCNASAPRVYAEIRVPKETENGNG